MQKHIAMPKALMEGDDKMQRRATLSMNKGLAWIDCDDMLRLTKISVQDILSKSADYQIVVKLIHLDKAWSKFQFAYAKYPGIFEDDEIVSDPFGKVCSLLLKKGRRPRDLIAVMDTSMLRLLLEMARRESEGPSVHPVCTFCGASDPRLRCSACKELSCVEVLYCSKGCQGADWKTHKKTCCKTRMTKGDQERMKDLIMQPASVGARIDLLEGIMKAQSVPLE